jgi:hypothetical protein
MIRLVQLLLAILAAFALTGCELIGNIFEAGVWVGVILVVVVVVFVGWIMAKFRR